MLFRLNRFKEIILNLDAKEGTLTFELKNLFECMGNNQTVSPNRFINNFYILFKGIFNKFEQNDICELYLFIIQKIHDEICIDNNNINKSYCNIFEEHNYKIACHNNFKTSKIYDLLQGSYMNTIECIGCGNINKNFEPFIYIGLDIEDNSSISELLLKHYIEVSHLCDENKDLFESKFKEKILKDHLEDYKKFIMFDTEDQYPNNWNDTMKKEKQREIRKIVNRNRENIKSLIIQQTTRDKIKMLN
jgi:hypothetical protein